MGKVSELPPRQVHYAAITELCSSVYRSIGQICFKFTMLEELLSNIIYMLTRIDRRIGRLIVKAPAAGETVDLIDDLLFADGVEIDPMDELSQQSLSLQGARRG